MVNLSRAKDAAPTWARAAGFRVRGGHPPVWNTALAVAGAVPMRESEVAAVTIRADENVAP